MCSELAAGLRRRRLTVSEKSARLDHVRNFRRHHRFPARIARPHFREHIRRENLQVFAMETFDFLDEIVVDQVLIEMPQVGRDLELSSR